MENDVDYTNLIYEELNKCLDIHKGNEIFGSNLSYLPFINKSLKHLNSSEFRMYYEKRVVYGISTEIAYKIITGKEYQIITEKKYQNILNRFNIRVIKVFNITITVTMSHILTKPVRSGVISTIIAAGLLYIANKFF